MLKNFDQFGRGGGYHSISPLQIHTIKRTCCKFNWPAMNRAALLTIGRKLQGDVMYLLSVFDLEPSGVLVHAYNQADSKEYVMPLTELQVKP